MEEKYRKTEKKNKPKEHLLSDKEKIKKRIAELQGDIRMHENRLNQANQGVQIESKQLVAKMGAVEELKKLL